MQNFSADTTILAISLVLPPSVTGSCWREDKGAPSQAAATHTEHSTLILKGTCDVQWCCDDKGHLWSYWVMSDRVLWDISLWWELLDVSEPQRQKCRSQPATAQPSGVKAASASLAISHKSLGLHRINHAPKYKLFCFNLEKLSHLFHWAGGGSISALLQPYIVIGKKHHHMSGGGSW